MKSLDGDSTFSTIHYGDIFMRNIFSGRNLLSWEPRTTASKPLVITQSQCVQSIGRSDNI